MTDFLKEYQWAVEELKKYFPVVIPRESDYGDSFSICVGNGLRGEKQRRNSFFCEISRRGPNAKGHYEKKTTTIEIGDIVEAEDVEHIWVWDDPDWQHFSLNALPDKKEYLQVVIEELKKTVFI